MNNKIILLVEDNPSDEKLTLMAFEKNKIQNTVVIARDGQEAVDYLFASGDHSNRDIYDLPQMVILDLKLPKLSGLEVLQRIRENPITALLPVIILTSSAEEKDVIDGYKLGVNSYVQKPVGFAEFLEAVRQLGLYWLLLNLNPSQQP